MLGSIYVLVAVAFTLAIGVLNFLNFSIPALFMIGGMLSWVMLDHGISWVIAIPVALIVAALISLLVQVCAYEKMKSGEIVLGWLTITHVGGSGEHFVSLSEPPAGPLSASCVLGLRCQKRFRSF